MKKKILIAASAAVLIFAAILGVFFVKNKRSLTRNEAPSAPMDKRMAGEFEEANLDREKRAVTGEVAAATRVRAAAPGGQNAKGEISKEDFHRQDRKLADGEIPLGKVFTPIPNGERRLEYSIAVAYQIDSLKSARAFFNQWIPRYGFMLHETASGVSNGYMTLRVRVRSSNLYAALNDLDSIGALTSENITVLDHTENGVYQQMLGAREDIRNRRRALANANTDTHARNWEVTENLLSQSEDKQLQTRMEEWRINDRTEWATIQITLALPAVAAVAPVEVPEFRNAFVGLLNVLLQLIYALIYIVPLLVIGYGVYRIVLRLVPSLRRLLPGSAAYAGK